MSVSVPMFRSSKFLEDFYSFIANGMGEEEHPRGASSPFFDDTSWAYCETLLGNSTDVREANYWHKWVADPYFHPFSHILSPHDARSRQPQKHPGHSPIHPHHAADTDDRETPNLYSLS